MRVLLLTDTHNELAMINELAFSERIDACIHCGDFGFYDQESPDRLTQRELQLRIRHSDLPRDLRKKSYDMGREQALEVIRTHKMLEGFVPYLSGRSQFSVPVYAVWGNHDDHQVIRKLINGTYQVPNLHLLHENNAPFLGKTQIALLGVGGNFYLEGDKLFASEYTGHGGTIRASWLQYARLIEQFKHIQQTQSPRATIFVSHVSPAKSEARLIERLCLVLGIDLSVSGHMDPPICHAYSLFAICEPQEVVGRSQAAFEALCRRWEQERESCGLNAKQQAWVDDSLKVLDIPNMAEPERGKRASVGSFEDHYYKTQFINLADTPEGWAILEVEAEALTLHTRSRFPLRSV